MSKSSFPERAWGKLVRGWHELVFPFWHVLQGRGSTVREPIQLVGCDRSGTSIISQLFCLHPDVFDFRATIRLWDRRALSDPDLDHYKTADDLDEAEKERIRSRFEFERRRARVERIFNQSNHNSVRMAYVQAIFPDIRFIHAIRDGRAVVESIVRLMKRDRFRQKDPMGWFTKPPQWRELLRDDPIEQAARQWHAVVEHVLEQEPRLRDRYIACRYEDVCRDCRGQIGRLWRFCGLPVDDRTLALLPECLRSENEKWRTALTRQQIATINEIQAPLLQRLGYEVGDEVEEPVRAGARPELGDARPS